MFVWDEMLIMLTFNRLNSKTGRRCFIYCFIIIIIIFILLFESMYFNVLEYDKASVYNIFKMQMGRILSEI